MIRKLVGLTAIFVLVSVVSCGESRVIGDYGDPAAPAPFESADSGSAEAAAQDPESVAMCPVTTCSLPWATCPSSKFPCDVDLLNDNDNCGGCGISCYDGSSNPQDWSCVDGNCTFGCGGRDYRDCDGDRTNGCEVSVAIDMDNCGECGVKCTDGTYCDNGECINDCTRTNKPDLCDGLCTNVAFDDKNCGTCGNVCDPTGPNLPPLPSDMYYGCGVGVCGQRHCGIANTANCNGLLSDGCETTLHTTENCNTCGDACPPGKQCLPENGYPNIYRCLCEDDAETLCGRECKRLDDDPTNCGGCNRVCPGMGRPHFSVICTHGVCGGQCGDGYADCDKLANNGCEVDTRVDNRNCGACGHACLPDQVCSAGKCLVAPCDGGAPGDPTK
jgi:hypothetical protein